MTDLLFGPLRTDLSAILLEHDGGAAINKAAFRILHALEVATPAIKAHLEAYKTDPLCTENFDEIAAANRIASTLVALAGELRNLYNGTTLLADVLPLIEWALRDIGMSEHVVARAKYLKKINSGSMN